MRRADGRNIFVGPYARELPPWLAQEHGLYSAGAAGSEDAGSGNLSMGVDAERMSSAEAAGVYVMLLALRV